MRRKLMSHRRSLSRTARNCRHRRLLSEALEPRALLSGTNPAPIAKADTFVLGSDNASAARVTFNEYPLPASDTSGLPAGSNYESAGGITVGPDGNIWFTEPAAIEPKLITNPDGTTTLTTAADPKVAEINPTTHAISEFETAHELDEITTGPDGNLWFVDHSGGVNSAEIAEMNPTTHAISEFPISTPDSLPLGITAGPDGDIWFTESLANRIGEINPSTHAISDYKISTIPTQPMEIISGPGGKLWFTQFGFGGSLSTGEIGSIDPTTHVITEFSIPPYTEPTSIIVGPDGNLWYFNNTPDGHTAELGRLNPTTGAVTEFSLGAEAHPPGGSYFYPPLVLGADGNIWFSCQLTSGDVIGYINPASGEVATFPTAAGHSIFQMVRGPDNNFWYTEPDSFVGQAVVGSNNASDASGQISVLANDTSADGQPQNLTATVVSATTHGTLTLNPNGTFVYVPDPSFQGIDRFTYQVSENGVAGNTATVTLLSYNASLVDKLYQQILHRPAEDGGTPADGGLIGWTQELDSGAKLDVVAQGIFLSPERLAPLVTQFYQSYLGRAPEPGGLSFWVQFWQAHQDPGQIVLDILSGPEFLSDAEAAFESTSSHPNANDDYVKLLYLRFLGRPASARDLAFWVPQVQPAANPTPASMYGVAAQFYQSHEQHSKLVDFLFGEYFKDSTAPAPTPFVTLLDNGATQTAVELAIIDSAAYRNAPPKPAAGTVGVALYEH